jgi:uncharacterized phiE125 gp8 family phage protein
MAWAPDYCEVADLKAFVRITDSADDAQLALAISAASRAIDRHCNRQFGLVAVPEARYYTPCYDRKLRRWVVDIDDLMTVTGLVVAADLDDSGDYASVIDAYALKPVNAQPKGRPWSSLVVLPSSAVQPCSAEDSVEVTARWGWTTVPSAVKQATLLQASRLFARRGAPFGIAGSLDTGSELRLLAKVDADVVVALGPYVRQWGAV